MPWSGQAAAPRLILALSAHFALAALLCTVRAEAPAVPADVLALAREYLAAGDTAARQELAERLDACDLEADAVVRALRPQPEAHPEPGYHRAEHFRVPELLRTYPDDLLYYVVPESYRPDRSTGLAVVLHGGSKGTERTMAHWYMRIDGKGSGLGEAFCAAGMIAVGPSAPVSEAVWERWCLPEADAYIRDVIVEFAARFNIDPDRVFLAGHSMGGFGAYQHIQVQPDRFAAVLVHAGSWYHAYWPVIRGTPLWMVQGVRDSQPGGRPHYTDVAFARLASKLLSERQIEHELREHPGEHALPNGMADMRHFIARMPSVRRDPFYPRIAVACPRGWHPGALREARHNRWLSILETRPGTITYDTTRGQGARQFWGMPRENWEDWELQHLEQDRAGASLEATNRGDNTFEIRARNVRAFALWLHPKMVDFAKPVRVVCEERVLFEQRVKPSLGAALRAFERRRDWGLVYTAEVRVQVPEGGGPN